MPRSTQITHVARPIEAKRDTTGPATRGTLGKTPEPRDADRGACGLFHPYNRRAGRCAPRMTQ